MGSSHTKAGLQSKMPEVADEIQTLADPRRRPQPEEGPLDILYEDEWMLVANKPTGLVVHPTYKNTSGTLLNAVLWHVRDRVGAQPGILTRLDKGTSGLVVIALTPDVHATDAERCRGRANPQALPGHRQRVTGASTGTNRAAARTRPWRSSTRDRDTGRRTLRNAL